jgi:hypothetical protein
MTSAFIYIKDTLGVWQSQNNVQTISIDRTRPFLTDPFSAARMTYTGRISTSSPDLVLMGNEIYSKINNITTFVGRITDVRIDYGFVPDEDTITVTAESSIAELGRITIANVNLSSTSIIDQVDAIATATGIDVFASNTSSLVSTQTYTGNALELLNKLNTTEYGFIVEFGGVTTPVQIELIGRDNWRGSTTIYSFTDDNPTGYAQRYDKIVFDSAADNYWTAARVEPEGLTGQQVISGTTPERVLVVQTLDQNTTQALNYAQFLQGLYNKQAQTIAEISATDVQQSTNYLQEIARSTNLGTQYQVEFRGTTYTAILVGFKITATPEQVRYTFQLSPADINDYLTLNDPIFGKLDNNRLGF